MIGIISYTKHCCNTRLYTVFLLFVLFISISYCDSNAQQYSPAQLDSLKEIWNNEALEYLERLPALYDAIEYYISNDDLEVAYEYAQLYEEIGLLHKDTLEIGTAYTSQSLVLYYMGRDEEKYELQKKALDLFEKIGYVDGIVTMKNNLAIHYSEYEADYNKSNEVFLEIDSIALKYQLWNEVVCTKSNLMSNYLETGDFISAVKVVNDLDLLANDREIVIKPIYLSQLYEHLAYQYEELGDYELAAINYQKCVDVALNADADLILISGYFNLGRSQLLIADTLSALGNFKKASECGELIQKNEEIEYFKKQALAYTSYIQKNYDVADVQLANLMADPMISIETFYMPSISHLYGEVKVKKGEINTAIDIYQAGLEMAQVREMVVNQADLSFSLSKVYELKGDYASAYEYSYQALELRDSILNMDKFREIAILKTQNAFDLERQASDYEHKEHIKSKERLLAYLIIGAIVTCLLLVLCFMIYNNYKKRKQAQLDQQLQEDFTQQLLENTEEERSRIASDLHDSVNHKLLQLKQKVKSGKKIESDDIGNVIEQVRSISHNLSPTLFVQLGLVNSIEELTRNVMEHSHIKISTSLEYSQKLSKQHELQVYRIIEEALNNIIKHSKATHAIIQLECTNESILLNVKDNGVGFDVDSISDAKTSFGLNNLKHRAKAIQGKIDFISNSLGTGINLNIAV